MKIIIIVILLYTFMFPKTTFTLGVLVNKKGNQDFFILATKVIEKNFNNANDKYHMKLIIYRNEDKIINDFNSDKIKQIVIHPFIYYRNKKIINKISNTKWIARINEKKLEQYYLIANEQVKDVKIKIKKDINNFLLNTWNGVDNSYIWFKYFYYKNFRQTFSLDKNKHIISTKEKKIMYNVFFKKNNIGVISQFAYDTMIELNPQLKKRIKIVAKSEAIFMSFLGFNSKDINQDLEKMQESLFGDFKDIMGDTHLSSSIKVYSDRRPTDKDLNDFYIFYKENMKLEKKYK